MCGIAGFIDSKLSREIAQGTIDSMLESISHRGNRYAASLPAAAPRDHEYRLHSHCDASNAVGNVTSMKKGALETRS